MIIQTVRTICPSCAANISVEDAQHRRPNENRVTNLFCPTDDAFLGVFEVVEEGHALKTIYRLAGPTTLTTTVFVSPPG